MTLLAMAGYSEPGIFMISGHGLEDVRSIIDDPYLHRDPRLLDAGAAKLDAMTAAPANDVEIGSARLKRRANGLAGSDHIAR